MEKQPVAGEKPGPTPAEPGQPRASRITTALLAVALVLVVVITGVLGTVAVLMTRNPDTLPGGTLPHRLPAPIHFAPVTATQAAPCPGVQAVLDEAGTTCYVVAAGINVTSVQKIESIREGNGTYAVRVALPAPFREQIGALTQEEVKKQIAVVVAEKVVAAPTVAQAISVDSLSITGSFSKEVADGLVARLLGGTQPVPSTPAPPAVSGSTDTSAPPTGPVSPPVTSPSDAGTGTSAPSTGTSSTGTPSTSPSAPAAIGNPQGADPKFPSCKEATDAGYGPYFKESHPEYAYYPDNDKDGVACDADELNRPAPPR
ncbi:excalibur calcium-binding domain-containing protein [Streptosporangium soli]|nr:excalibur calcium-binding domain-containing protein [Streptosporangium sp. KLBMP 9127]